MHTATMILFGLALLAGLCGAAGAIGGKAGARRAAHWFLPTWLAAALINMWIGVTSAGYTVLQEMPVTVVIFGVPALSAVLLRRRLGRDL